MRNLIVALVCLFFSLDVNSQVPTIVNGSFENWIDSASHLWPDNWMPLLYEDVSYGAVSRNTSSTSGQYSLRLGSYVLEGYMRGGWLFLMDIPLTAPVGGFAFDYKSFDLNTMTSLDVEIELNDSNGTTVVLKDWSITSNTASFTTKSSFFDASNATHYTIRLMLGNVFGPVSAYAIIDNLRFLDVGSSLSDLSSTERTLVYPCPATDHATIQNPFSERCQYKIHSMTGEQIYSGAIEGNEVMLNTNDIAPGIYIVTLNDTKTITTTKLIKY